jgi:metallo-beta-lactamase class B
MFGPTVLASALASSVLAWGVPPALQEPTHLGSLFQPDPELVPDAVAGGAKDIVRSIIRRHINEVKACYEEELAHKPGLAGRMLVQFSVSGAGKVIDSVLVSSTLGNARVERCGVMAVRRWQFPKTVGGGIVIINYPFVFEPDARAADDGTPAAATPAVVTPLVAGTNGAGAVEIEQFAPTLFVHRSTDAHAVTSNGLVAVTSSGGLLLVDTAWTEAETEAILAWGDDRLRRPWIGAVITHDHADRAGGLAALERRRIPVAALDLTVAKLAARGVNGVTTLFRARDGAVKDARGFEAFYPGPGHASDNIVLRFAGLVYGGCLVKSMAATDLGFTGDADLPAWPAAIRSVRARYADRAIVPGHGPIDLTGDAYQHTLDLLATTSRRAARSSR